MILFYHKAFYTLQYLLIIFYDRSGILYMTISHGHILLSGILHITVYNDHILSSGILHITVSYDPILLSGILHIIAVSYDQILL